MDSQNNIHKRGQAVVFRGKAGILQLKRGFENLFDPNIKRHSFSNQLANAPVIAKSKTATPKIYEQRLRKIFFFEKSGA